MKAQALTEKAVAAMESAIRKVIADHKQRNRPLAVWVDGRVVMMHPAKHLAVREARAIYGKKKPPRSRAGISERHV